MILLYRALWIALCPLWLIWLSYRIYKGKEDFSRITERFGVSKKEEKNNPTIWLHAASVGESMIAVNLANKLSSLYPDHNLLITTGTVTSAKLVEARKPANAIHQYIPIDEYFSVRRFFENWKPQLGITLESEIWPNLLTIGSRYCPIILTNAIMSDKSYNRWMGHRKFAQECFKRFSKILCQSGRDAKKYSMLLCQKESHPNVTDLGNLKYSTPKLTFDQQKFDIINDKCGSRNIVLAASTHDGDEDLICQMHIAIKKQYPDLLTIIAPRHPKRAESIKQIIESYKLSCPLRSIGEEITNKTDIYLADTLGELGLFFNLAKVTIIGGSFKNGGHNPIEPAFFDTHIVFGPDMNNFKDVSKEFLDEKAAYQIENLNELNSTVVKLLETPFPDNGRKVLANHGQIMDNYIDTISQYIK